MRRKGVFAIIERRHLIVTVVVLQNYKNHMSAVVRQGAHRVRPPPPPRSASDYYLYLTLCCGKPTLLTSKDSVATYMFIERKWKSLPDSSQILTVKTRFSAEGINCLILCS